MTDVHIETEARPRMIDQPGVRFGLANGALVITTLLVAALRLTLVEAVVVMILVAGVCAAVLPAIMRWFLCIISWAWVTGFVVNSFGQLSFDRDDRIRLAVITTATLLVSSLGRQLVVTSQAARHG